MSAPGVTSKGVGHRDLDTFRRGHRVRVRDAASILATLDENGDLDGMPFMPEMLSACGKEWVVNTRADKTCDTIDITGCSRELDDTVHLTGARCDGSAHGGCQAGCLLYFKTEWLERVPPKRGQDSPDETMSDPEGEVSTRPTTVVPPVLAGATMSGPETYRCQATQVLVASRPKGRLRHWWVDIKTRNAPMSSIARAFMIANVDRYQRLSTRWLPPFLLLNGGHQWPDVRGRAEKTPVVTLDLQPGDWVEIKSLDEIRDQLTPEQRNRGLHFDREMVPYCGKRARVLRRVDRLIDEKSGRMLTTKTASFILEDVVCPGLYHLLCPRQAYAFYREAWLRRVDGPAPGTSPLCDPIR